MTGSVEISYAEFLKLQKDLDLQVTGDGRDANGKSFWIRRYKSRVTGKIYDCVQGVTAGSDPQCMEIKID